MRYWFLLLPLFFVTASETEEIKMHSLFLMQNNEIESALQSYQQYCSKSEKYDFETLQQLGIIMLQKGIQSDDPQTFLMSLFGAGVSGSAGAMEILEKGLHYPDPQVQLLSLHFITALEDDKINDYLNEAMSSDFLSTRMEAAFYMCKCKHPMAVGQIEGLMARLPTMLKPYFPSFFALLGTNEATKSLKRLLEDNDPQVRIESILNIAKTSRDDFLPQLRRKLSHSHIAEIEATIYAIGALKDTSSLSKLKKLAQSPTESIRLASAIALHQLGDRSEIHQIISLAKKNNLFAIFSLGKITDTEEILSELAHSPDFQVRINAGLALLQHHDARCLPALCEILITDSRDLAFHPMQSVGRTLTAFKAIPSAEIRSKDPSIDLSYSTTLRESFLKESLLLPEEAFLALTRTIFLKQQNDLVPTTIALLENLRTPASIALLKEGTRKISSPLIRDYCHLSLYRLKEIGPYEERVTHWILQQKTAELIRLRPILPWKYRMEQSDYTLSTEETSRLLIDSFLAVANRRNEQSISLVLKAMQNGLAQNRYPIMGLLMRATE
ncbi:MAG TPA: HEAT repeat domain-containing protein [Chlamydiales bacterium]|nr:HEAT repeat domain-containing protein [Chlamydiales bacterium]